MKYDTIIRHTEATAIDFDAPGAAMRLAWKWTAQELWSARKFDTDHVAIFARFLRTAWVQIKMMRENRRRANLARGNERVQQLNEQRKMLQNKSAMISIRAEEQRIDDKIQAITNSL